MFTCFIRKITTALFITALAFFTSGCSVYMASQDTPAADVSIVQLGQSRAAVENVLGKPVQYIRKWHGDEARYLYFGSAEKHYGRAALYAVADVFTLGVSEFITTPIEHMQREQFEVVVLYDRSGNVSEYTHYSKGVPVTLPEVPEVQIKKM